MNKKSSKLLIPFLFVGLLFSIVSFTLPRKGITNTDINKTISVGPEKQVGQDGASTVFTIYHTSPESPDSQYIFHLRYQKEPDGEGSLLPGELWICSYDLKEYRHITDIKGMPTHNGADAQWLDNHHIVLLDSGMIRVIDIRNGNDMLTKKIETPVIGHHPFQGKVLFGIHEPKGERLPGIYELDCFTGDVRTVLLIKDYADLPLPGFVKENDILPVKDWRTLHYQYSPDGKKVCFRLDVGNSEKLQLLGLCNIDGSDPKITNKPLHQLWYDNESITGHVRFGDQGEQLPPEKKFLLMRWDLDGNYMETMGIKGCHLAVSPAGDCFVSETMYGTNPVIVSLTLKGQENSAAEIARFDPLELTWGKRFHINPAFSRDGKRIYYSKPLDEKYNGTFYREITYK